jgi:hypothetical protein
MRRASVMNPFRHEPEGRSDKDQPEWNINPPADFALPTLAAGS